MFAQIHARLRRVLWERQSQIALLMLLALAILWRGGRTLEMTLLLCLVACAIVFFRGKRSREAEREVSPVVWWMTMLFVAWTAVSYLFTTTMNYGFDEVAQTASLALLFLWMARRPEDAKIRTSVLRVLSVAVLLACLIGVLIYAMGPLNRFVGTFLDMRAPWKNAWPNAWAELLLLAWPVSLLLSRPDREQGRGAVRTFWKIVKRTTPAGVMVGCLLLSFSRAAFLAFLGQGLMLVLWSHRQRFSWKRATTVAVGTLAIALVIFGLSNHLRSRTHAVQSLSERTLFLAPEGNSSIAERRAFWKQSFVLALQRPFFGWGPGSFRFAQTSLMEDVFASSDHPHNVYLKAAAERGWPAAILLLALTFVLFLPLLKGLVPSCRCPFNHCPISCVLTRIPRRKVTTRQVLLLTALLGVLAHNLVDYNLQFVAVSLPAVLLLGMLAESGSRKSNKKVVHSVERAIAVILLAAVLHEGFFAVSSSLARRADAEGATARALTWYGWSTGEWYSRDLPLALARLQMQTGSPDAALRTIRQYTEVANPVDARGWVLQAEIAAALNDTALADDSYRQAYTLGRYTDLRILHGLFLLLSLQSTTEMKERQDEFSAVLQRYYDAILQNSHYIALTPNVEEFLSLAEIMAAQYPADAPRYQVMAAGADRQARTERLRQAELLP
ncbi:MAG: O-antigen ligase family protein [Candidatus Peribacteraceae bacterium]|nr:O-antigen ligase family protein [Candidatus Peribacteraceae bacterium]MDD5742637.1 O-antigen ligase family protein [Candidatus Peribacteraceae bacterium]